MGENTKYNSNLQKNSVTYPPMSQIEELRAFKTKAVTIFMVVQFMMGTAMYILKVLFE